MLPKGRHESERWRFDMRRPVEELTKKELKEILFRTYQWPPSSLKKDVDRLRDILRKARRLQPDVEEKYD